MTPDEVVAEVSGAVVQGRGGAGFPAGNKWKLLSDTLPALDRRQRRRERAGHVQRPDHHGARPARRDRGCAHRRLRVPSLAGLPRTCAARWPLRRSASPTALNEAYAAGYVGKNILGSRVVGRHACCTGAPGLTSSATKPRCSKASRATAACRGRSRPFFPAAIGLYLEPTIVNNVETLANLPWIMVNGAEAFAAIGSETVERHATDRGVRSRQASRYLRSRVRSRRRSATIFYDPSLGGGIRDGTRTQGVHPRRRHRAVVLRGASRPGARPDVGRPGRLDARFRCDRRHGRHHRHGAGVLAPRALLRQESCGKCTPCREGTAWLETILARILAGHGRPEDLDLLVDVGDNISPGPFPGPRIEPGDTPFAPFPYKKTTICDLGPSVVSPLMSAVRRFRKEFDDLYRGGVGPEVIASV